jgi:hypothetical protein
MTTTPEPSCDFCNKRGLAVLPVRYAMVPTELKAPKTRALDADGETALPELGETAHYTRRLLRPGYLYVYDEKRTHWHGYFITIYGHLMHFEVGSGKKVPPSYRSDAVPCMESGHFEIAGMVTISDAKNAGSIWFGYSDVEWTDAVLEKHNNPNYRKQHMQLLDVPTALAGGKQPNAHPMQTDLKTKVAEYACNAYDIKYIANGVSVESQSANRTRTSPFLMAQRKPYLESTLEKSKKLHPNGGVILSLHDPVGVAVEVAAQMNNLLEDYLQVAQKDQTKVRKFAVATQINQWRMAVHSAAESDRLEEARTAPGYGLAAAGPGLIFQPELQKTITRSGELTAKDLQDAKNKAWRPYTHQENGKARFDEAGADEFYKTYNDQLREFKDTKIIPLGQVHVSWVTSRHMKNYLASNFDTTNVASGLAYLEAVIKFTDGTQGVKPCFALYEKWVNAEKIDPTNALLRALVLNQDTLEKQVTSASAFDLRAIPWDNFIDSFKTALESVPQGQGGDRLSRLLANMAGPLAKPVGAVLDGLARPAVTALGMIHGGGWKRIELQGSRKDMRAFITRMVIEMNPQGMKPAQIKVAVDREVKLAQIRGEKLEGHAGMRWLAWLNPKSAAQGDVALRTPSVLADIRYEKFKASVNTEVRGGVCVALVQAWCLSKSIEDFGKAMEGDKSEAGWRLAAGCLALSGTLIESLGVVFKNMAPPPLPNARFLSGRALAGKALVLGGKALGLVGGVIMGVWDFIKMFEEFSKKNNNTAWLFAASGTLGIAVAVMFAFGIFNVFTLLAVAAFLITAYFLEKAKSTAIQTWLENSIFGSINIYTDGEKEMKEYKLAIQ